MFYGFKYSFLILLINIILIIIVFYGFKYSFLILIIISSSSSRADSTDIPDTLSPLLLIVHRLCQVFRATSRILT